jgi:uncharacterized protein involved in exopolysaccharide biosynthesis
MMIVATIIITLLGSVGFYFTQAPRFTAEVTILPRAGAGTSGLVRDLSILSGLAPEPSDNLEPLYNEIVHSDAVLDSIVQGKWSLESSESALPLSELLGLEPQEAESSYEFRRRIKKKLRRDVLNFRRDFDTGFMVLRVTIPNRPSLASALAKDIVERLDAFNTSYRSRKNMERRMFIERRLEKIEDRLNSAGARLVEFLSENRDFDSAPALRMRHQQLTLEFEAQKSLWIEMRRQLEMARVEENKRLTSVDVLDVPRGPAPRTGPSLLLHLLVGAAVGFMMSMFLVIARHLFVNMRPAPSRSVKSVDRS